MSEHSIAISYIPIKKHENNHLEPLHTAHASLCPSATANIASIAWTCRRRTATPSRHALLPTLVASASAVGDGLAQQVFREAGAGEWTIVGFVLFLSRLGCLAFS